MPDSCKPTGNERWVGDWEYVGAIPQQVVSGHGPGGVVGTAMSVTHVWRREYEMEYACCEGNQQILIWVAGNYAVYTQDTHQNGFPVVNLGVGVPLPGALGVIADLLGAGINIATWWADPNQPDGERPSGPGEDAAGNAPDKPGPAPQAECGEFVLMPDGTRIPWYEFSGPHPPGGSTGEEDRPELPPPPPREPHCCDGLNYMERRPVVNVVTKSFTRTGSYWFLDLEITVSHQCGLRGRPQHQFKLMYGGSEVDLTSLSPAMVKGSWKQQPNIYQYKAEHQQMPVPPANPNPVFRISFTAVSECNGIIDYELDLEAS